MRMQWLVKGEDHGYAQDLVRIAQAVTVGCGYNQRIGLFDGILIKASHILAAGASIQIEVESLDELRAVLGWGELILLDNFDFAHMREAVALTVGSAELEASDGINLSSVRAIAEISVDRIAFSESTGLTARQDRLPRSLSGVSE